LIYQNIDVHQQSTVKSNETAIDGITSGLINLNETVTWRGKFWRLLKHKSLISAMVMQPTLLDEMLETS
jgi:hypothetical protein